MAGWALGQGQRRRVHPQLSRSSPVSPRWPAERQWVMPSAEMVSARQGLGTVPSVPSSSLHPASHTSTTICQLGWDWSQVLVPITWGQLGSGCSDVFVCLRQQGWSCGVDQEGVVGLTISSLTLLMPDLCALVRHLPVGSVCRKEDLEWAVGLVSSLKGIEVPWLCHGTSV